MCFFPPCDIWWPVWVRARAASNKRTVSLDPAWFPADSGANLFKQGEIVTVRPCGPIAQWSEYLHGLPGVLGLSLGRVMCLFLPCDTEIQKYARKRIQHEFEERIDKAVPRVTVWFKQYLFEFEPTYIQFTMTDTMNSRI